MGQVYRYDPKSGRCNYQEPSAAQLKALQEIEAAGGTIKVTSVGWRTALGGCVSHEWLKRRDRGDRCVVLTLTDAGRAELQHQRDRAKLAEDLGLPNTPQLAKLMYEGAADGDDEEGA